MTKLQQRIDKYEKEYSQDYGFEHEMVKARQRYVVSLIHKLKPRNIVEIGCGQEQLFDLLKDCSFIESWTIIEPSDHFVTDASKKLSNDGRVKIVQGFVEDIVVKSMSFPKADLCIVSGLLHEIEEPEKLVGASKLLLNEGGVLHANVPNAQSMHRQLAVNMGFIQSVYEHSDRNQSLIQYHVFDMNTLHACVEREGLTVIDDGGYFVKPFTHKQMETITEVINDKVLDGLWTLGVQYPELASEIYVNARLGK